jgi:hypothetical protein
MWGPASSDNEFRGLWRKVQAGESGLIAVFLQWSVDPAYRAKVPDDFQEDGRGGRACRVAGFHAEQQRRPKPFKVRQPHGAKTEP